MRIIKRALGFALATVNTHTQQILSAVCVLQFFCSLHSLFAAALLPFWAPLSLASPFSASPPPPPASNHRHSDNVAVFVLIYCLFTFPAYNDGSVWVCALAPSEPFDASVVSVVRCKQTLRQQPEQQQQRRQYWLSCSWKWWQLRLALASTFTNKVVWRQLLSFFLFFSKQTLHWEWKRDSARLSSNYHKLTWVRSCSLRLLCFDVCPLAVYPLLLLLLLIHKLSWILRKGKEKEQSARKLFSQIESTRILGRQCAEVSVFLSTDHCLHRKVKQKLNYLCKMPFNAFRFVFFLRFFLYILKCNCTEKNKGSKGS